VSVIEPTVIQLLGFTWRCLYDVCTWCWHQPGRMWIYIRMLRICTFILNWLTAVIMNVQLPVSLRTSCLQSCSYCVLSCSSATVSGTRMFKNGSFFCCQVTLTQIIPPDTGRRVVWLRGIYLYSLWRSPYTFAHPGRIPTWRFLICTVVRATSLEKRFGILYVFKRLPGLFIWPCFVLFLEISAIISVYSFYCFNISATEPYRHVLQFWCIMTL
jgi:hypothetical protein